MTDRAALTTAPHLHPLAALGELADYQVAAGDPDVRGWELCGPGDARFGTVEELFVDVDALKVRYFEVTLAPEVTAGGRRVLIPIGLARLDVPRRCVLLDALDAACLARLPAFGRPLDAGYEQRLCEALAVPPTGTAVPGS